MDISEIRMSNLFLQLGLEADDAAIAQFITEHQLPAEVHIVDAPYWNQGQRSFLRETMAKDGAWIHIVDALNESLHEDAVKAQTGL
ncbi:DUF2789 domain-containing protein [Stenotrophomonas sp. W1S232]|jgi:hypothetical protein|uniref:DUF2789 domain-containing protein n=1 Tax=Stenotrophomonas koreensis TaxID=266128 RepID=A0A0R0C0C3_9GAMM|nr:DUF2789 family protein [Stenotrophomonas koreensis]KRG59198.1 hypothetical protein ABB25_04905 [Stenotrophomonas koreensis]MBB1117508.1 DUF2789 domain-containing protein [Stenotrophomonas koreensis]